MRERRLLWHLFLMGLVILGAVGLAMVR